MLMNIYKNSVVNVMRESGCQVPEWMLNLKKPKYDAILLHIYI